MTTQLQRTASAALGAGVVVTGVFLNTGTALGAPVPVGTPPSAVISVPGTVWAGIPITLSGARSTSSGTGVSEWEWNLDGKGGYERDSLSTAWVSKAFGAGKHTVTLRVRNGSGLVDTTSKTFTARKPPAAVTEPTAPLDVQAVADGTAVTVTWQPPLGVPVLAYRVSNAVDDGADPIYVPATAPLEATFDGLVPGDYGIRVAAINAAGTGPGTDAATQVVAKGGPSASPSAAPTSTPTGATGTAAPTSTASSTSAPTPDAASSSSSGDNRDAIGLALIGAGGLVLLGAAITGVVSAVRRRRAD